MTAGRKSSAESPTRHGQVAHEIFEICQTNDGQSELKALILTVVVNGVRRGSQA